MACSVYNWLISSAIYSDRTLSSRPTVEIPIQTLNTHKIWKDASHKHDNMNISAWRKDISNCSINICEILLNISVLNSNIVPIFQDQEFDYLNISGFLSPQGQNIALLHKPLSNIRNLWAIRLFTFSQLKTKWTCWI